MSLFLCSAVVLVIMTRRHVMGESIPTVDMSQSPEDAASALFDAASNYGFFYLENHGVSAHDMQQGLRRAKTLFDWYLPSNVWTIYTFFHPPQSVQ